MMLRNETDQIIGKSFGDVQIAVRDVGYKVHILSKCDQVVIVCRWILQKYKVQRLILMVLSNKVRLVRACICQMFLAKDVSTHSGSRRILFCNAGLAMSVYSIFEQVTTYKSASSFSSAPTLRFPMVKKDCA
jgi:hypothetical protein